MKKHLVMICGAYFPHPSATASCAERYVSLFREEYEIDIIACSEDGRAYNFKDSYGANIHVLTNTRLQYEHRLSGFLRTIMHRLGTSLLYTSFLGNQRWYAKAALAKLIEIHEQYPIDVVFSVCSPFAAHVATVEFCALYPQVLSVAYTVDPYSTSDRICPIGKSLRHLKEYETSWLSQFDHVFFSEEVYEYRRDLTDIIEHCQPLPYLLPPINRNAYKSTHSSDGMFHCVYAGSFYKDIRNPQYMLQVFSLLKDKNVILHLYSNGCDDVVAQFSDKNVIHHGQISPSKIINVYSDADALVGVGNSVKEFLPSKTFEYVAMRKPIIYFNYPEIDNPILNNYPRALQIDMRENMSNASSLLLDFLNQLNGEEINEQRIYELYIKHTPDHIKQIISMAFEKNNSNGK